MRYLITGGAGFIGAHLAGALVAAGHSVVVLDDLSTGRAAALPACVELVRGCITDAALVAATAAGTQGIYHLAAIASVARSNEEWLWTHRVNQGGTVAVLDAARSHALPVVYASSAAVYGAQPVLPIAESLAPAPLTAYGADKLGSELHGRVAATIHGVANAGLRFFNVYGPGQRPDSPYSGVISIFADRISRGLEVTLYGDGGQTRDFVFVGDVVQALQAAMRRCASPQVPGQAEALVCNVCTGKPTSIADLARQVMIAAAREVAITHAPPRAGDIAASVGDPARAEALIGFRATTGLESGLESLLAAEAIAGA